MVVVDRTSGWLDLLQLECLPALSREKGEKRERKGETDREGRNEARKKERKNEAESEEK